MSNTLDIAIIGAGITGLGVALALKQSGLKVGVFEKSAICQSTSNNHLRIIHGGFRYLQSLDLKRMWQSSGDQLRLSKDYPDLIQPLPCLLPLKPFSLRSRPTLTIASLFYSLACGMQASKFSIKGQCLTTTEASIVAPLLKQQFQYGAFQWQDYLLKNPILLAQRLRQSLADQNITILEEHQLESAMLTDNHWQLNFLAKQPLTIQAKLVINCAGPQVHNVANILQYSGKELPTVWLKAFNLVVNRKLTSDYGLAFEGNDGGMFFMTPRDESCTAIGTFYTPTDFESDLQLTNTDIEQAIQKLNQAAPALALQSEQIIDKDLGVIPAKVDHTGKVVALTKEQIISAQKAIHVVSIKYTTFLSLGEKVARSARGFLSK